LDLRKQRLGHVGAAGFALFLPGEVVTDVFVAVGTVAGGLAAGATDGDQGGGQDGALGLELFLTGAEGSLDQGRMYGCFHGMGRGFNVCIVLIRIRYKAKNDLCEEKEFR